MAASSARVLAMPYQMAPVCSFAVRLISSHMNRMPRLMAAIMAPRSGTAWTASQRFEWDARKGARLRLRPTLPSQPVQPMSKNTFKVVADLLQLQSESLFVVHVFFYEVLQQEPVGIGERLLMAILRGPSVLLFHQTPKDSFYMFGQKNSVISK